LGADVITGFPGETDDDHAQTRALIEELPYTYLHIFPFSPRSGTAAAELNERAPVPPRVAGERARELRGLASTKGERHRERRVGARAEVTLEGGAARGTVREPARSALTGDYLRVGVAGADLSGRRRLHTGTLRGSGADLYIDLSPGSASN
jgi:threonylcarbamoyladenosine tRNA methylthiotransferase MtaB